MISFPPKKLQRINTSMKITYFLIILTVYLAAEFSEGKMMLLVNLLVFYEDEDTAKNLLIAI